MRITRFSYFLFTEKLKDSFNIKAERLINQFIEVEKINSEVEGDTYPQCLSDFFFDRMKSKSSLLVFVLVSSVIILYPPCGPVFFTL